MNLFFNPASDQPFINEEYNIKILVIDSGYDIENKEIQKNIIENESKSFVQNELSLFDYTGHGTNIISLITGNYEMYGLYPHAKIVVYKVTNKFGNTYMSCFLNALNEAIKNHYKIICITFSAIIDSDDEKNKIQNLINLANKKSIIICWSAANNFTYGDIDSVYVEKTLLPHCLNGVFIVGSLNNRNVISSFVVNNGVDVYAPGGEIYPRYHELNSLIMVSDPTNICDLVGHKYDLPPGYSLKIGNSLATAYATVSLSLFQSAFERKYGREINFVNMKSILLKVGEKYENIIEKVWRILKHGSF
ncbi:hypothetical protein BUY85_07885 [Staphylococcus equorum]|uniref:S8 family peptidase n=1 Tax=Staphylococcus equorum TaxID=246432 RepID=UPI000D1CC5AD|nr:S8 family serine peptidase [Staphylococcus equorum]PTE79062.1 hypothetical protein BUY85_07885 [Staphylococcus equorum]